MFLQLSIALIGSYAMINFIRSIIGFLRLPRPGGEVRASISYIIPARNEEGKIGKCISSLLPWLRDSDELIVVDDCSEDSTEAEALSKLNEKCKLIRLIEKPEGWSGKSWACYQGYLHSSGDIIVFLDADTVVKSDPKAAISLTERFDALSQVPRISCGSLACGAIEVALTSLVRLLFPYWKMSPGRAWLMGAFSIWRRESYESVGTHEAVRSSLVEDADLARLAVAKGLRISFFMGRVVESSWIRSWREGYETIKRIGFAAMPSKLISILIFLALSYTVVTIYASPLLAYLGLIRVELAIFYLVSVFSYASLSLIEVKFRPESMILSPIALSLVALSLLAASFGKKVSWKGRDYSAHLGE
jgi:glycosyltransferase involved in cell wall biosynthesis